MSEPVSPFKGKTGLVRILNAAGYSWAGLRAAFSHEDAFRQEVLLVLVCVPMALALEPSAIGRALLIGTLMLVLIVELLNSAIEAVVDRISLENNPLAKIAKDMGSAAVLLSLLTTICVWTLVLTG